MAKSTTTPTPSVDTQSPTPTVEETTTPTPSVDSVPFKEDHIPAPGRVATVTHNPSAAPNAAAGSNEPGYIHNLATDIVVRLSSYEAAHDLVKTDPERYAWASDEQIEEYKNNNNGEN